MTRTLILRDETGDHDLGEVVEISINQEPMLTTAACSAWETYRANPVRHIHATLYKQARST